MEEGILPPRAPVPAEQLSPVPAGLDAGRQLPGRGRAEGVGGKPVRPSPRLSRRTDHGPPRARLRPLPRRADAGERADERRGGPVRPSLRVRPVRIATAASGNFLFHPLPRGPQHRGLPVPREIRPEPVSYTHLTLP